MKTIRRIPTEQEMEDIRFNRMISRIQAVCHIVAMVLLAAGIAQAIYGVCLIEGNEMMHGFVCSFEGMLAVSMSALLANM